MTLIKTFGTLENIIKASESRLSDCPGFGATKATKLYKALHQPFLKRSNIVKRNSNEISTEDLELLEKDISDQ